HPPATHYDEAHGTDLATRTPDQGDRSPFQCHREIGPMKLHVGNWHRGGLVSLLLVLGLFVALAGQGRTDDPKKTDPPKPADKASAENKASPKAKPRGDDDEPAEKAEPMDVAVGPASGGHPATDLINKELAKFWKANNVKPSARATDYEFIRRV